MPQDLRDTLLSAAGLGMGAVTGGAAGAAAGLNITANNYLDHRPDPITGKSEIQQYLEAKNACERGNSQACGKQQALWELSRQRDAQLRSACGKGLSLECGALTKQAKDMGNQLNLGTPEYKLAGPVARSQSPYDLGGLNHPEISSVADVRQPSMREQLENGLFRLQDAYANDLPGTGTLLGAGYQMLGGKIEHLPQVVEWGTEIGGPLSTLAAAKSGLPKAIKGGNVKAPTGGTKNLQTTVQNNGGQGPTTMPAVAAGSVKHVNPTGSMQNCTNCAYVVDQQLATGSKASALPMSQPLPFLAE